MRLTGFAMGMQLYRIKGPDVGRPLGQVLSGKSEHGPVCELVGKNVLSAQHTLVPIVLVLLKKQTVSL
jgi:hypothetical protein